ncbi:hypothetical protein TSA1_04725 [Bradyrhizobium nitroreducens]|uniref:Uncharacterized protein n=1 Tax=Bradyrhizobium nitroreducens TaxID=709803 RepID=A0A2M6U6E6_9BRAD|nr:hypothetical protein [Bradyrhizobium nitroreducens]PIT00145.1 hypothetical protein TSA1_04725 [Bradyrhizobium nitroreducens]
MLFSRRTLVIALLLSAASPTSARSQDRAALVREAFASPYGKALTIELGKALRTSADPSCLAEKGLAADQLEPRGHDIILSWGTRMFESTGALIDQQNAANPFPGATERERLERNADVKRFLAIEQPMRQAKVLDLVFEHFDRYVLISGIKLGAVSPVATGNKELLDRNPIGATEDALERFVAKSKSSALKRFLELSEQAAFAQRAATGRITSPPPLPHTYFRGVEDDLAALCIRSGK